MLKKIGALIAVLLSLVVGSGFWLFSLLDDPQAQSQARNTMPFELPYLADNMQPPERGRILAVVTSTHQLGDTGKSTGFELTELARAYTVFSANGFTVDIASPAGGSPPMVIDNDDMGLYDYAFLNDSEAKQKLQVTLKLEDITADIYDAVYFVGGKGAMFDFPNNLAIKQIVAEMSDAGKVISAVCHGPAALLNVNSPDGKTVINGRKLTAFTNAEELFLIPNALEVFPFLLQSELESQGAVFVSGHNYLNNVVVHDNWITGQNPWSVWQVAEGVVRSLGFIPVERELTAEELSVFILQRYQDAGFDAAALLLQKYGATTSRLSRNLIVMHSIVAAMQWEFTKVVNLLRLAHRAKQQQAV